jgi:type II secretory pathway pseudopilin PulG
MKSDRGWRDIFCKPSSSPPHVLRGRARVGVFSANRRSTPTPTLPLSTWGGGNSPQRVTRAHRGWVFLDVLMAITIVAILTAILGLAVASHRRGLKHLADSRSATRLAESALISMQSGQSPSIPANSNLAFHELPVSPDLPGDVWIEVEASVNGRPASLVGLVPRNSLPHGGGS